MCRYRILLSRIVLFTIIQLTGHILFTCCFTWGLKHGQPGGTGMFIVSPGSVVDPDSIELEYEDENHKLRIGELLNKQAEIYEALGVALPTLSC